jgi:hypothetical protein
MNNDPASISIGDVKSAVNLKEYVQTVKLQVKMGESG